MTIYGVIYVMLYGIVKWYADLSEVTHFFTSVTQVQPLNIVKKK